METFSFFATTLYELGVVVMLISQLKVGVRNSIMTPLVFVKKGIRNLKCCFAAIKCVVGKQVDSGRHSLNQQA